MKKTLSLILAFVLCLGLCACSSEDSIQETEVSIKESVIGTWEYNGERPDYKGGTYLLTTIIELYQGGTGKYHSLVDGSIDEGSTQKVTWEIKDGVLNVTIPKLSSVEGFFYDASSDTLTRVDNTETFTRKKS